MQQVAHPEVTYNSRLSESGISLKCDRRQVAQAMTNLLQNAADALTEAHQPNGEIVVSVLEEDGDAIIEITDNGPGFPEEDQHRLTEPYVTHRDKGTGLGLAIVKKVMEDHGGQLVLARRAGGGASARLIFVPGASLGDSDPDIDVGNEKKEKVANHG